MPGLGSRGRATGKIRVGFTSVKPQSCWDLRRALIEWGRLVDQHDRDAIAYCISQFAALADQDRLLLPILQLAATLGTHENLEKLPWYCHPCFSSCSRYPKRASALLLFRQFGSTFTQRSRYTLSSRSASTLARAACPMLRTRWPFEPMR